MGILGLPLGFYQSGYILSSFIVLAINSLVFYTTCLMLEITKEFQKPEITFGDVYNLSLGRKAVNSFKFFLFCFQTGICVCFVIFFTKFFETAFGAADVIQNRIIFLLLSLVLIIPMTMINTYHFFYKWSRWANVFILATLSTVIVYNFQQLPEGFPKNKKDFARFDKLPSFMGIAVFSFECVGHILPVRNSMREPEKFKKIFFIISFLVTLLYIFFGTLCCLALGNKIDQIILMGIEKEASYFIYFQAFYALALILTYPLQIYPVVMVLEMNRWVKPFINKNPKNKLRKYLPRFGLTAVIFFIAFLVPKFSTFLNFVGSFSGTALQFVFPILAYQIFYKQTVSRTKTIINYGLMIIGVVAGIFATVDSISEMAK